MSHGLYCVVPLSPLLSRDDTWLCRWCRGAVRREDMRVVSKAEYLQFMVNYCSNERARQDAKLPLQSVQVCGALPDSTVATRAALTRVVEESCASVADAYWDALRTASVYSHVCRSCKMTVLYTF